MDELAARRKARLRAAERRRDRLILWAIRRCETNGTLGPPLRLFLYPSRSLRRRVLRLEREGLLTFAAGRIFTTWEGRDEVDQL